MPGLYVATNGLSVWASSDFGETIGRMPSGSGLYSGSQVWALAPHPVDGSLFAGTDSGIYRLASDHRTWTHLPSPMDDKLVTAIAVDPAHPETIIAGTQPAALYRSDDGGTTWVDLQAGMIPYVQSGFYAGERAGQATDTAVQSAVKHWARVTAILFYPDAPGVVLAGVEIDGVWRSTDGGRSWNRVRDGLVTDDIHGFGLVHNPTGPATIEVTTCDGLHASRDAGLTWQLQPIDSPWQYVRTFAERADGSGVAFLTNGNGPPGTDGRLFRTRDFGATWEPVPLPVPLESSLYFMATHPSNPNLIFATTNLGQLFRSDDGGEHWDGLKRRLPEVRALAWIPD